MTKDNVHIIMSALDESSYCVTQPLGLPPMRSKEEDPVFASDPNHVVVFDQSDVIDDEDLANNKNKDNDLANSGSTRDQSKIFAFTNKGFLKLIENHGNDISNWPQIRRILAPSLQVEVMLHQIHGVCWMVQMEQHLSGAFGINSILWQEREFEDGGKYYYSPAVGQARLDRPPLMKGGLLCDEMGKYCRSDSLAHFGIVQHLLHAEFELTLSTSFLATQAWARRCKFSVSFSQRWMNSRRRPRPSRVEQNTNTQLLLSFLLPWCVSGLPKSKK